MAKPFAMVLSHLRAWASAPTAPEDNDGQLLEQLVCRRDELAFETLLHKHGALVWRVCRRVLGDGPDAEDAFQATFLVLFRKAGSLGRPQTIAGWLYTVACRVALRARATAGRRRHCERQAMKRETVVTEPLPASDLRAVLDEEVSRLPRKYVTPLVLCYFEGKTEQEAAGLLGWPRGTLSCRLARAREVLRQRLDRRGLALSVAALATMLAESAATAAMPLGVTMATMSVAQEMIRSGATTTAGIASAQVSALTEGVLRSMFLTKLKIAMTTLAACLVLAASGFLASQALSKSASEEAREAPKLVADQRISRDEFTRLFPLIKPQDGESKYLDEIAWPKTVWDARKKAAAEGKPLFVVLIHYSPLGQC